MKCRAVAISCSVERLSEQLVQLGSRDVKVPAIDAAVQSSAHNRNCFSGPIRPEQRFPQLVVHARKSVRRGMNRSS
jgi:hypothetical protein